MASAHSDLSSSSESVATRPPESELHDLHELVKRTETAKRENAHLHALIEGLQDGVVIMGPDSRIVVLNEAARRLIGIGTAANATSEAIAKLDVRRFDMTRLPPSEQPMTCAIRGDVLVDAEMLLVRPDGEVRSVLASCTSSMENGQVALAIVIFRDITKRRDLERRLAEAERLAAVATLAAGVSHKINNPLASVMSNIELVIEELRALGASSSSSSSLSGQMTALAEMLLEALVGANRVGKIVRSLKTLSRSEDLPRTVINVQPAVELAVKMTFNETHHRARVVTEFGPIPLVKADEAELGGAFINLLVNAAHAFRDNDVESNEIRIITATNTLRSHRGSRQRSRHRRRDPSVHL